LDNTLSALDATALSEFFHRLPPAVPDSLKLKESFCWGKPDAMCIAFPGE
jgi:hypothetical protein